MEVVCFGQQNWDVCWTAKQQFLTRLAARGHRVLYLDPDPSSHRKTVSEAVRSYAPLSTGLGLRREQPGLWVYTYHNSPFLSPKARGRQRAMIVRRLLAQLSFASPTALVLRPEHIELVRAAEPVGLVYYAVDEWTGFGGLPEERREQYRCAEEAFLEAADVALGVSPRLVERFARHNPQARLLPNAADVEHFSPQSLQAAAALPEIDLLPRPRLGFVGQIDERLDQQLLQDIAAQRPQWQIVLVGRVKAGVDVSALTSLPNVHLTGFVPYERLPSVMRGLDVCLLPYIRSALTQSCCPLKVYEYLATGLPVVGRDLEGMGETREVVTCADQGTQFVAAIEGALADPDHGRAARLGCAARHSWERRTDELERHLNEAMRRGGETPRSWGRPRSLPLRSAKRLEPQLDAKERSEYELDREAATRRSYHQSLFATTRIAGRVYHVGRMAARLAVGRPPQEVRRILVNRRGFLGDWLCFLPTLRVLRRSFPQARIDMVVRSDKGMVELVEAAGLVDQVHVLDFSNGESLPRRLADVWRVFRQGYDLMISGSLHALVAAGCYSGAPRRLGMWSGYGTQRLNNRLLPLDGNRHEVDNNIALVEALGGKAEMSDRLPWLPVDEQPLEECRQSLWREFGIGPDRCVIAVHPGAKRPSRRWPSERFAALLERVLTRRGDAEVILTGVAEESALSAAIRDELPEPLRARVHIAAGKTDLQGLIAVLEASDLVIANDTGTMHLAQARGRPLLALLGPENERRWGPYPWGWGPTIAIQHEIPCTGCHMWHCPPQYCLRMLGVDEAFRAASELMDADWQATPRDRFSSQRREPIATVYRKSHHDWQDVAEHSGRQTPVVSIIDLSGQTPAAALAAMVVRQAYPSLEVIVADPARAEQLRRALPSDGSPTVRVCPFDATAPDWAGLVESTRGWMLCFVDDLDAWPVGRIGRDVGALLRITSGLAQAPDGLKDLQAVRERQGDANAFAGWSVRAYGLARLSLGPVEGPAQMPVPSLGDSPEIAEPMLRWETQRRARRNGVAAEPTRISVSAQAAPPGSVVPEPETQKAAEATG